LVIYGFKIAEVTLKGHPRSSVTIYGSLVEMRFKFSQTTIVTPLCLVDAIYRPIDRIVQLLYPSCIL